MEEDWQVLALKSDVGFDYEIFEKPAAAELPQEVDLVLDGARAVSIWARDTNGEP